MLQQHVQILVFSRLGDMHQPNADGGGDGLLTSGHAQGSGGLIDALGNLQCCLAVHMGQNHRKFFSTHAAHNVLPAQHLSQCVAEAAQQLVATGMAVAVVDLLEVIKIQHEDGDGLVVMLAALQNTLALLQEGTTRQHIRQRVVIGGMAQLAHQLGARHV